MMEPKKTNTTSTVDSVPVNNKYHDNGSDVGADVVVAQEQNHPRMNELEVGIQKLMRICTKPMKN